MIFEMLAIFQKKLFVECALTPTYKSVFHLFIVNLVSLIGLNEST